MGVWFHYPPNFDPNKNILLWYTAGGGPQSALTQYFSVRWNFALMTANDYIVVAQTEEECQVGEQNGTKKFLKTGADSQ